MLRQWDTGEALRADGAAAVPHVPPQYRYRRRFPHIARWSVAAVTPDAVSAVSADNAYTDAAYKRDKPFWSGLPSGGPRSDSRAPWLSPSPATRRRSTAEPRWLRELAENEELTVRRLACGGHAECMMRALGNSVLRERVMGSSRQGQQLLCHGQQPVRGNRLSWATAYMSWATACQGQQPVMGNSLCVLGNSLSGATACQGQQLICHGQQPVRGNSLSWATAYMSWATAC